MYLLEISVEESVLCSMNMRVSGEAGAPELTIVVRPQPEDIGLTPEEGSELLSRVHRSSGDEGEEPCARIDRKIHAERRIEVERGVRGKLDELKAIVFNRGIVVGVADQDHDVGRRAVREEADAARLLDSREAKGVRR